MLSNQVLLVAFSGAQKLIIVVYGMLVRKELRNIFNWYSWLKFRIEVFCVACCIDKLMGITFKDLLSKNLDIKD